jgi:hypothetical protein
VQLSSCMFQRRLSLERKSLKKQTNKQVFFICFSMYLKTIIIRSDHLVICSAFVFILFIFFSNMPSLFILLGYKKDNFTCGSLYYSPLCLLYCSGPAADHPEGAAGGATQPSRHADRQPGRTGPSSKKVRVLSSFLIPYNSQRYSSRHLI